MDKFTKGFDRVLRRMILFIFNVFHKECDAEIIDGIIQFAKFGIVGVSNTVVSYVINILVLLGLRDLELSWDYIAGNVISFLISVLWSFYWNEKYVFILKEGETRSVGKALLKSYISYGFTGIILNNVLSWIWISFLSISKYIAPIINLLASVPINFIVNKMWAFKKSNNS
ncbi:GtrA family protein [Lacrimispora sp. NSJ-141]|uniref:GtrA family protein n=1 Tax=Lientehia hominis TaxID=2897778 RepID=A0AAP2RIX5_9FIRM|nr:GtrA family protein [Lientehia hominis]MCD2492228.1 GtrA family protein [Lientehia hominis]